MTHLVENVKPDLIPEIKSRLSCRTLYQRLWPDKFREKDNCLSFCHDDRTPSCQVSKEAAYCHTCKRKFDALDLYCEGTGLSKGDAIRELAKELGLNNGSEPSKSNTDFTAQWTRLERNSLAPGAIAYLEQERSLKGIVEPLKKTHLIGFSPRTTQWPAAVAFPLTDWQRTTLQGIQYIPIGGGDKKFAKGTPAKDVFFRMDGSGGNYLVLTEGIVDCLSVLVACKTIDVDVAAILSAGFVDKLAHVPGNPVLFFDNDDKGREATAKAIKITKGNCRVVDWTMAPAGMKDCNDLLRDGHADIIERMIQASRMPEDTTDDEPPITIISGLDLISADLGHDNPVIVKLLGEKESLLLTGASGIGKSLFVNNVALVLGDPPLTGLWGMFPIPKAVSSIFVQSENSAKATQRRLKMIMEGAPYLRGGIERIFYPMIKDDIRLIGDLQEHDFQERLKEIIAATRAGLLILDPLISYHWKDENSNSDMRKTLDCLTLISEDSGAACLVVHHVGKNGMSARGASAIEDWAANILALEEVTRHDKTFIQATHKKSRNFDRVQPFFLERTRYLELLKADPQEVAGVIDVLEALKDAGGEVNKKSEFIELVVGRMNCSEVTARRAIAKAQTSGLVVEIKTGRKKAFKLANSDHDPENSDHHDSDQ